MLADAGGQHARHISRHFPRTGAGIGGGGGGAHAILGGVCSHASLSRTKYYSIVHVSSHAFPVKPRTLSRSRSLARMRVDAHGRSLGGGLGQV